MTTYNVQSAWKINNGNMLPNTTPLPPFSTILKVGSNRDYTQWVKIRRQFLCIGKSITIHALSEKSLISTLDLTEGERMYRRQFDLGV